MVDRIDSINVIQEGLAVYNAQPLRGNNTILGGDGDDVIITDGANNYIDGGAGNDDIIVTNDSLGEVDISAEGRGVWGDPHYEVTGANGEPIKFDHHGIAGHEYHVFSGDNISITGLYAPSGDQPCVISETTLRAGDDTIQYDKEGNLKINGQEAKDGEYDLADGTKIIKEGKVMTVVPADGTGKVDIHAEGDSMMVDPSGQFKNLDGILGTAIAENRPLPEDEANQKFDLANAPLAPKGNLNPFENLRNLHNEFLQP